MNDNNEYDERKKSSISCILLLLLLPFMAFFIVVMCAIIILFILLTVYPSFDDCHRQHLPMIFEPISTKKEHTSAFVKMLREQLNEVYVIIVENWLALKLKLYAKTKINVILSFDLCHVRASRMVFRSEY